MIESQDNLLGLHLARFLVRRSGLAKEDQGNFARLIVELVAAIDAGHSYLRVEREDQSLLEMTPLVSDGGMTPLVLSGDYLYLKKYYEYEVRLAKQISQLAAATCEEGDYHHYLDGVFGRSQDFVDYQRKAAELAITKRLAIISGGPGTGKTSTVVAIIGIFLQIFNTDYKIALAAPTGKAAMRLRQAVLGSLDRQPFPAEVKGAVPDQASTLHRLLGVKRYSSQFVHNSENPMEWDVVVVDEASMVDLALMSKLVDALKPDARLILLGDKDQLVSVESGAVLSDLIKSLPGNTMILQKSYRFEAGIKSLADAVNTNDSARGWTLLHDQSFDNIGMLQASLQEHVCSRYGQYFEDVKKFKRDKYQDVFLCFNNFRVLCANRRGRFGVEGINRLVEGALFLGTGQGNQWYMGRPVMIQKNDYNLELYNGDLGICLPDPDDENKLKVWFETSEGHLRSFSPFRLPQCQTVFAMTIHKSQGSEFDEVLIVLPEQDSQLLSRELLYTAITRARKKLRVQCDREVWDQAVSRKTTRASGLATLLGDLL